jgi:hypothetical protein
LTGIHQRTAPTKINRTDWNDLITFLGGTSNDPQVDATKILLAQGGSLLSTWRYASDLTKMDAAKVAGNIAAAQMQTNVLAAIIAAGGIVDADVNAAAAIAPTKLGIIDACRAYAANNQTIVTSGWRLVALGSENFDTNTMHDLSTNNSRITIKKAGLYILSGLVSWFDGTGAGTLRGIAIFLNSASIAESQYRATNYAGGFVSTPYLLAVNDYVELYAYQDSGGNLDARGGSNYTFLSAVYVGRTV